MAEQDNSPDTDAQAPTRKRPKPGERRVQILQTLAVMLEQPGAERITTAALAARLDVSEAALYRHFASKAQMFEGLIEFIEETLFGLINKITAEEKNGIRQLESITTMLLGFAQKNRGMTRVLIGDALVHENERLQARINQLHDRVEAALKQSLRFAAGQNEFPTDIDPAARANLDDERFEVAARSHGDFDLVRRKGGVHAKGGPDQASGAPQHPEGQVLSQPENPEIEQHAGPDHHRHAHRVQGEKHRIRQQRG